MTKIKDKILTCRDCNHEFTFTVTEQEDFAQKGFTSQPGRCPECQIAHKARRVESGQTSGVFGSASRTAGAYSGAHASGDYGGARREMFPATCARCGKDTQVPFQPRTDRPVYCSDCYSAQRQNGTPQRRSGGGGRGRG